MVCHGHEPSLQDAMENICRTTTSLRTHVFKTAHRICHEVPVRHTCVPKSERLSADECLRDFFQDIYPISFHSHASDALAPHVLGSVMRHLAYRHWKTQTSQDDQYMESSILKLLQWDKDQQHAPRLAVLSGAYGAAYGNLVWSRDAPILH